MTMTIKEKRMKAHLKAMTAHTKKTWTRSRQYKKEDVSYTDQRGKNKP